MGHVHNEDEDLFVIDGGKDPVVADAVPPEILTDQFLAEEAGILQRLELFFQEQPNPSCRHWVEFLDLLRGLGRKSDGVAH